MRSCRDEDSRAVACKRGTVKSGASDDGANFLLEGAGRVTCSSNVLHGETRGMDGWTNVTGWRRWFETRGRREQRVKASRLASDGMASTSLLRTFESFPLEGRAFARFRTYLLLLDACDRFVFDCLYIRSF